MSKHAVSEEHSNPAELFCLKALVIICLIKLQTQLSISEDTVNNKSKILPILYYVFPIFSFHLLL